MPDPKVYHSADCDPELLSWKRVVIVGYGSQGRAWALNLRDSEADAQVALLPGSKSIKVAAADWVEPVELTAVKEADIVVFAFPDHEQVDFYETFLKDDPKQDQAIVFLSGLNIHFENIKPAPEQDIILLAPHGPGTTFRERYLSGEGLSCFLAVAQDYSGKALDVGLSLAAALGCSDAGIHETTFKDEAIGDLFGEQALLVGGLAGMTMSAFDKLVEAGLQPRHAYLETVAQLRSLVELMEKHGPVGLIENVSKTAAVGSLMAMLLIFSQDYDNAINKIYEFVESGEFNKFLQAEGKSKFAKTHEMLEMLRDDPCQKTVEEINRERKQS